jgi:hypothetical protein
LLDEVEPVLRCDREVIVAVAVAVAEVDHLEAMSEVHVLPVEPDTLDTPDTPDRTVFD